MRRNKLLLLCAIVVVCICSYQLTPHLDEAKRWTLVIFVWATLAWIFEVIPLFVTSFVVLVMQVLFLGLNDQVQEMMSVPYQIFLHPFFSPVITLFMGGFAVGYALQKYELDLYLAQWLFAKSGDRLSSLMPLLLYSSAFCSMWISNTATTLFLMMAVLPVVTKLANDPNAQKALLLSIPIGANIGGMVTPIGTPPNAIVSQVLLEQNQTFYFSHWLLFVLPITFVLLWIAHHLLRFLFPARTENLVFPGKSEQHMVSLQGKMVMLIFAVTVLLWLLTPLHGIPEGIVAIIPIILLFSTSLLEPKEVKELGWDTLILVGGGVSLGVAMKESGLAHYLIEVVYVYVSADHILGPFLGGLTLSLSTVISNTAATGLILPLSIQLEGSIIINSLFVALCASLAMALPVSSPPNAIIYSSGYIKVWDMLKIGVFLSVAGFVLVLIAAHWLWPLYILG